MHLRNDEMQYLPTSVTPNLLPKEPRFMPQCFVIHDFPSVKDLLSYGFQLDYTSPTTSSYGSRISYQGNCNYTEDPLTQNTQGWEAWRACIRERKSFLKRIHFSIGPLFDGYKANLLEFNATANSIVFKYLCLP